MSNPTPYELELEELFVLTQREYNELPLTASEFQRYLELVELLHKENIEIPFGISI